MSSVYVSAAIFVGSIWVLFQHKPSFNRKPKPPSLCRQISPLSPHLRLLQSRMSGSKRIYEAWMEKTISEENGPRVIHYYLSSASATGSGSSLLAVVGTERGNRHYEYVVSERFLEEFGSSPAINANTKWTSRKIVIEWIKSLVRKDDLPLTNSNLHNLSTQEGDGRTIALTSDVQLPEPMASHEGHGSLDAIPSGVQEHSGAQLLEPMPREQASFQVGDAIELLSKDVDMQNCWYRCKVLESCNTCLKVQFNDKKNEEGSGKFEDYFTARRLAPPDNLSMRHSDRLTIRPCPPEEPATTFEVGAAVDAWWMDVWWEGFVLTVVSISSSDSYHVFLPGPGKFLTLRRKDLRASRDWVDDTWVPIESHPDILSFVFSHLDNSHNSPTR